MIRLVAKQAFVYAGVSLKPGDDFVAVSEKDAEILVTVGRASRAMNAFGPEPRRRYSRRDMRAEE